MSIRLFSLVGVVLVTLAVATACSSRTSLVKRVVPGVPTGRLAELTEATLATLLVCNAPYGMDVGNRTDGRCEPCMPLGATANGAIALRHARGLWTQMGRTPHDTAYQAAGCVTLAFEAALRELTDDPNVAMEFALFRMASRNDSVRALGLRMIDSALDARLLRNDNGAAERLLGTFARAVWERSQRMLERPPALETHAWERDAHRLREAAPALRRLPAIPRTSSRLGVSEAEWSARLFDMTATLTGDPARRSSWHRLALAPSVVLHRWGALDSAARALLVRAPNDSSVLPARALAAYKQIRNPVYDQPAVMSAFDVALRHMPRADSLQHDSFDEVLRQDDDDWRYGFLPSDRLKLDQRGWTVLDPIWSTAVNEVRLAKRARVAEANYRYADIAMTGQSGSEVKAGEMLVRRGPADSMWTTALMGGTRAVQRGWQEVVGTQAYVDQPDFWRATYSAPFTAQAVATWPYTEPYSCGSKRSVETLHDCVKSDRASWDGVPFWGTTDTIDVTAARFRARGDSSDLYIGARLPLRRFKYDNDFGADKTDRIAFTLFLTTGLGDIVYRREELRELPPHRVTSWTAQWAPRVRSGDLMHRVEALEPTRARAARGAVMHTSDAAVSIPLSGFGISDLLVAASGRAMRNPVTRWSDLTLQPNGGVIAPGAPFLLGWEIYDLTPAPDGRVRWSVSIRRENGEIVRRSDARALLRGARSAGDRVLADEPGAPAVRYDRDAPAASALFEHVTFNMGNFPPGRHVVEVRIEDLVAKRTVARSVTVRVLPNNAQPRAPLTAIPPRPLR